jgi:hypothetical protein
MTVAVLLPLRAPLKAGSGRLAGAPRHTCPPGAERPWIVRRVRFRSSALTRAGICQHWVVASVWPQGRSISRLPFTGRMNSFSSLPATAVMHRRASGPDSIGSRAQHGAVARAYFSFQLRWVVSGRVCLFQGWYGERGHPADRSETDGFPSAGTTNGIKEQSEATQITREQRTVTPFATPSRSSSHS